MNPLARPPGRLTGIGKARSRFGDRVDRLIPFYGRGDALADAASAALSSLPVRERMAGIDAALEGRRQPAPELDALLARMRHVPFWVDRERCERGARAFLRMGLLGGVALGFASLPGSYCSRGGNKPLVFTGRLTHGSYSRLVETGHFLREVCTPGSIFPGGVGWKSVAKVRLMHSGVRNRLSADARWQGDEWGVPINQADMSGTVLLFSWIVVRGVRALGGIVSDRDAEDLQHLWRYAGWLMGVEEELLCSSTADAEALFQLLSLIDAGPDEDSKTLIAALFAREIFEGRIPNPRAANELRRLYQALARKFIGDEAADQVELPRSGYDHVVKALPLLTRAASKTLTVMPFGDELLLRAGKHYWENFLTR